MPSRPCQFCGAAFSNDGDLNLHLSFIHSVGGLPPGVVITPRPLGFGAAIQLHNQLNPQAPLGSTLDLVVKDNAYNYTNRRTFLSNITFPNLMASLAQMSSPIAGHYILGRTTGFTLNDGQWWFVLVGRQPNQRKGPTSLRDTVFLATMRSELMTSSQWDHALIWHVRLSPLAPDEVGFDRHEQSLQDPNAAAALLANAQNQPAVNQVGSGSC